MQLKPFISEMWASLNEGKHHSGRAGNPPTNTVWRKTIHRSLVWIMQFFNPEREGGPFTRKGSLTRVWTLASYLGRGIRVSFDMDASPYGLGAVATINGKVITYIESKLTHQDAQRYGHSIGSSTGHRCRKPLARKLTIELGVGTYSPNVVKHTPSVTNVLSDVLSRLHDPKGTHTLPPSLRLVTPTLVHVRDSSYYVRSLPDFAMQQGS